MAANFNVEFNSLDQSFDVDFQINDMTFEVDFGVVHEVLIPYIPKEYGLVTYDQDKTITIT